MNKAELAAAFPEVRYIGPGSLGGFLSQFGGTPHDPLNGVTGWPEVDIVKMQEGPRVDIGGYLMFMPRGMWLHFLPAWISVAAEYGVLASGALTGLGVTLVPDLLHRTFRGQDPDEKLSLLNPAQVEVIHAFGEVLAADTEIERANGYDVGLGIVESMDRLRRKPLQAVGAGGALRAAGRLPG